MKKGFFSLVLLLFSVAAFAQLQTEPQWNSINGNQPGTFRTQLVSSSERSIQVNLQVPGFYTTNVTTPRGEAKIVSLPKAISTAKAGEPNLPMTGIPALIGDQARMSIRVVDAQYIDYEGIEVAPSKGDFSRQIDPASVPYTYSECYNQDAFFPANNIGLYAPYIIRDFRGQNMVVYPFAYNPVTKTLRVYYNMTVEMYKVDDNGENPLTARRSNTVKMDPDFKSVYQRHFINYEEGAAKYTVLDEEGDLLIICYDNFISSMTDFVNWKKTRGINTTIVGTSTAGSSYTAIQTYIRNQYNANNNLTHVLLVGDVAQIPGYTFTDGGSNWSGKGDNQYGQIVGNDIYNDVIIGRFSAGNASQVTTQVNRILTYERDLTTSATWCQNGLGISASAGSGGHYNEDDYQHVENLRTDLLNYGYSTVYQDYAGNLSGYPSSSTTTISNHINSGVGIINYCNHGEQTGWQSHYYMNSNVNALTNNNKLPFIFSVACLVGQYDYSSGDCFAETWMHATNGSTPTGAISGMFSYISQPWIPPMWAQDEFVDILVESYSNNIKHSFGGAAINSLFSIFDHYSTTETSAIGTYKAWVLYGDPTLMMRTKTPQAMTVTHNGNLTIGASNYAVNVSNGNGAVATITDASHNILGKATVSNGTATVSLNSGNLAAGSQLTLCVFGYNKVTYLGTINVVGGTQYNITVTQPQHGTISAPAQAYANSTVTLTATPDAGYCLSSWTVKKGNTNIPVTNNQFTMPEGNVTVTATFVTGLNVTLAPATNGTISADPTCALQGTTINLTATPASGYVFDSWVVYKTGDANTTVTVSGNSFTMPNYPVTVVGIFSAPQGGDVTIGSGTNTSSSLPTNVWYKYTTSQQIYTAAELGDAGTITAVSFKYNGNATSGSRTIDIYMTHTTSTTLSTWVAVTSASKVYSGSQTFVNNDWYTITLDTPFEYNGTSNIMITVDDNTGSYSGSSGRAFYSYSTGATRAIYNQSDNYNVTPMSPQSGNNYKATTSTSNSQIIFTKEVPSTDGYLSVTPTSLTGFNTVAGTASTAQSVAVIGANLQANLTVTAPNGYEVSATQNGSYNSTLTLTPSNGSVRSNVFVRLKSNASAGSYNGNMTFASGTATATVSLSGTITQGATTQYTIAASANPTAGGTVDGAGTYNENSTCTLTATANTGYTFTNWTQNGSVVSTNATYSFTVTAAGTYVANFSVNSYEITATADPTLGGTITGAGTYNYGTTCTLTATANEGHTFVNWTKNGTAVSSNASFSFTVTEAATYVANFTINSYNVTATANPTEGGIVTVGSRNRDDLVYDFEDGWQNWTTFQGNTTSPNSWMHNTEYPTSNNDFTTGYGYNNSNGFMLSESYISGSSSGAGQAVTPDNYLVSPQVRLGGSISFYAGARNTSYCSEKFSVLVSTTDNTNAASFTTVATWTLSLSSVGYNSTPYTVDLSAYSGMGYVAIRHFDCYDQWFIAVDNITIVEGVNQNTGSGNFNYGETCTVTATPNDNYHFVNWTENGTTVSSEAVYSFTVTGDRNLVANFSQQQSYTITATANPTEGGSVTGEGSYVEGSTVTLTATANEGYTFINWTKNGTQVSTNATYTFTVNESAAYVANFEEEITDIEQTSTLAAGWNQWSSNVDLSGAELLAQLKQALGTNGIKIMAQNGRYLSYNANTNTWMGNLTSIEVGVMYKINVSTSCEVTLTGPAIDPANHPITLYHGNNWIGFFGSETMSLSQALSNYTPTQGDKIMYNNRYATFNGSTWIGNLTQLVPGNGYIYKSNATSTKTLYFISEN